MPFLGPSLTCSREACFAFPNRRACSQAMVIRATETYQVFARLLMSENRTESFAIVQTFHLMIILSSCRSVQHVLNLACFSKRDTYHARRE